MPRAMKQWHLLLCLQSCCDHSTLGFPWKRSAFPWLQNAAWRLASGRVTSAHRVSVILGMVRGKGCGDEGGEKSQPPTRLPSHSTIQSPPHTRHSLPYTIFTSDTQRNNPHSPHIHLTLLYHISPHTERDGRIGRALVSCVWV